MTRHSRLENAIAAETYLYGVSEKCNKCNGALFLREDDIPDTIQQRLNIYHQQTEPVIKYYIKKRIAEIIDSQGSIEQIKTTIIERITAYKN